VSRLQPLKGFIERVVRFYKKNAVLDEAGGAFARRFGRWKRFVG
jgi:hypothetical protein